MTSIIKISSDFVDDTIDQALSNIIEKRNDKDRNSNNKKIQTNNVKMVLEESKTRSCVKAITWRLIATLTTMSISYFYLNDMSVAAKIGLLDSLIKFASHYIHERVYSRIKWGYNEREVSE